MKPILLVGLSVGLLVACGSKSFCERYVTFTQRHTECVSNPPDGGSDLIARCHEAYSGSACTAGDRKHIDDFMTCLETAPVCVSGSFGNCLADAGAPSQACEAAVYTALSE